MTAPTVSVIVPTYNGAALIGETFASLKAQSFTDFEVIVVDDCSTDDTRAVVAAETDPRFRLIAAETNQGVVASRNRAVAAARGRYLAALDHDDLCLPDRFARQVAYLDSHPDTMVLGTASNMLEDGAIRASAYPPLTTPSLIEWLLNIENPLVWSTVMIRTDAARALDPFQRLDRKFAEDFDLYHRLAKVGRVARLDDVLLTYRHHAGGASKVYMETMRARAAAVLADVYAALFGEAAETNAALIAAHVMGGDAVSDRATFARLGEILIALQDDFLTRHRPDSESRALIRWETARRWAKLGRAGLRTGHLSLGDTARTRPDHLGLGYAGIDELVLSRLVGSARATRRLFGDRAAS